AGQTDSKPRETSSGRSRFNGDYGIKMTPERLRSLCEVDWPTQGTNWPSQGSYDRSLVASLWANIIKDQGGHPDQIPYIDSWLNVIDNNPPWLKKCRTEQCKIMALRAEIKTGQANKILKKPIYQGPEAEVLAPPPPPPYVPTTVVAPAPNAPPPVGQSASGTRTGGRSRRRTFTLQYIPFSTVDLLNWKTHTPAFAEKPQAMLDLLSSIFAAHEPNWSDCQQLLNTLFTSEERRRINTQAWEYLKENQVPEQEWPNRYPLTDPRWDPNEAGIRATLNTYREILLHGVRRAARKPTDLSRVAAVVQRADESPGDFLERLMEAYRIWTPFDPEAPAHELMVNAAFIGQCAKDIRTKIQKQPGFQGMSRSQIMAIAQKVFEQRGEVEKKEKKQWMKEKAAVIAAAMAHNPGTREVRRSHSETRGRGGGRGQVLGRNQCAVCKQEGHWKDECPQNRG
uniref:CCHC-type domain-containing protein n=1 Tax=Podarcis muralis TaxID=64176 RepID=A0A670I207_PODMU